jgi:fructoselysine-6-phosphate deglycase
MTALGSVWLGDRSIVVLPSLSGTTPETQEALSPRTGAKVIAFTGHRDTPVARGADVNFTNCAEDGTSSESFYLQSPRLALAIRPSEASWPPATRSSSSSSCCPTCCSPPSAFEPRAAELAHAFKDEPYHIITGAGATWAQARYYETCILEEMQ